MASRNRDSVRGRVDADTAQYFAEIASLVGPDGTVSDPEERAVIATNAMEEAQGKEVRLACDTSTSHVLEGLLSMLNAEDLIAFLERSAHGMTTLALNPSGSHVADAALRATSAYLALASDSTPPWLPSLETALAAICQVLAEQASDVMCSRYGSHVLRNLLAVLSGVPIDSTDNHNNNNSGGGRKGGNLAAKLGGGGGGGTLSHGRGQAHQGQKFPELLASLAEAIMKAVQPHVGVLRVDPSAGPVLQALLVAAEGDEATVRSMIAALLLCPDASASKDGRLLSGVPVDDVIHLVKERSGSHLVEVILRVAPDGVYKEILKRFFRGRLLELSQHPTANFVVQSLIAHARSGAQVSSVAEELEESVATLIKQRRSGVVAALLAAANRFEVRQKELCKAAAHAVGPKGGGEGNLAWGLMMLDQTPTAHPMARMSTLGCAMLQTILSFPIECCQQFAENMATLEESQLLRAAKDGGGSRAIEAFLTGTAGFKLKNRLLSRMKGHFAEMAMVPQSSFTVEKCFNVSDFKMKERIASELAAAETDISRTAHGPIILQKCSVADYARNPEGWRHRLVAKQDTRREFEEIFGSHAGGGGKQRGGTQDPDANGDYDAAEANEMDFEEEEDNNVLTAEDVKAKKKKKKRKTMETVTDDGVTQRSKHDKTAAQNHPPTSEGDDFDTERDGNEVQNCDDSKKKRKKTKKNLPMESEDASDHEEVLHEVRGDQEEGRRSKKKGKKVAGPFAQPGGLLEDSMDAIAQQLFAGKKEARENGGGKGLLSGRELEQQNEAGRGKTIMGGNGEPMRKKKKAKQP